MNEIIELFREGDNFILAGHTAPDGDAIGSCFALALALHRIGKKVRVVLEPFARKYMIIPGRGFLFAGDIKELSPEIFVALDCADPERLGAAHLLFERADKTVCIDHHETNTGYADYNLIEGDASSTSEMTARIIEKITDITPEIAAAVYAGMVSDTGGFRYNATAKSTMETAAHLMEMIPFTLIYNELMHVHRFAAGKALGIALANSERTKNKKIVYTHLTREMLNNVNANNADLDGVVEYIMGTRTALIAIFVYEKNAAQVKVSLRSKGPNVAKIAMEFGGGGHALAAGATTNGKIEEILPRAINIAERLLKDYGNGNTSVEEKAGLLGVINVCKEKGYTSHDVAAIIRKITKEKVGHTGTLDPDATGVLPVCIGRATKLADYFLGVDKTYSAEIVLGITTDTGDMSGEILSRNDVNIPFEELKAAAESFSGVEYDQVPPMYSAVKVGGKKLYELARKGETIERPARTVKIHSLHVNAPREDGKIFMEVTCSKGTYIRSLCMDIGEKLGCGAVMGELIRTRSGIFSIENSYTIDEIKKLASDNESNTLLEDIILPVTQLLPYPVANVTSDGYLRAINGNPIPVELVESDIEQGEKCWLYADKLIGLFSRTKNTFRAEVMLQ